MKLTGCDHCREVCQEYKIGLPKDLEKTIKVIRDNLADETIVESDFWPDGILKAQSDNFSELNPKGPWQDSLLYFFGCPKCNQIFQLSAETYHGAGGSWKPINQRSL